MEKTKARLRKVIQPKETITNNNLNTSLPFSLSLSHSYERFPHKFTPDSSRLETQTNDLCCSVFLKKLALKQESANKQIGGIPSPISKPHNQAIRSCNTSSHRQYFRQERQDIGLLSKWLNYKMDIMRKEQNFDFSVMIEYRQQAVNLCMASIMDTLRKYSIEAAILLEEVWNKTFGFMEFVMDLLGRAQATQNKTISSLKTQLQQRKVDYQTQLQELQKLFTDKNQVLSTNLRRSAMRNRLLTRRCKQVLRSYRDERIEREYIEEGLVKSLQMNMQMTASGEQFCWAHKVARMLGRLQKARRNCRVVNGTKHKQRSEHIIQDTVDKYMEQLKRSSDLDGRNSVDFEHLEAIVFLGHQAASGRALLLEKPQNASTSTADLLQSLDFSVQARPQVWDIGILTTKLDVQDKSTQNTIIHQDKGVMANTHGALKKNSMARTTRTMARPTHFKGHLSKSKLSVEQPFFEELLSNQSREIEIKENKFCPQEPPRSQTIENLSNYEPIVSFKPSIKAIEPRFHQSAMYPMRRTKTQGNTINQVLESEESVQEFRRGTRFSEIYFSNKHRLLMDREKFINNILERRSFRWLPNNKQYFEPTRKRNRISLIPMSHPPSKPTYSECWQDPHVVELNYFRMIRQVKNRPVPLPSDDQALNKLLRLFSTIIQKLCYGYRKCKYEDNCEPLNLRLVLANRLFTENPNSYHKSLRKTLSDLQHFKREKDVQIFLILMGLHEGSEIGSNELWLYVRTYCELDESETFLPELKPFTSHENFIKKINNITQGYFKSEQVDKLVKFFSKDNPQTLSVEDIAKYIVKKSIDKKRMTYSNYEFLYELSPGFSFKDMAVFLKYSKVSSRVRLLMLKYFTKLLDKKTLQGKCVSYQRFWTFCQDMQFPTQPLLYDFYKKQSEKAKDLKKICLANPRKAIDLLVLNNIEVPALVAAIASQVSQRTESSNRFKIQLWTHFLIFFCHNQIFNRKITKLIPRFFQGLDDILLNLEVFK